MPQLRQSAWMRARMVRRPGQPASFASMTNGQKDETHVMQFPHSPIAWILPKTLNTVMRWSEVVKPMHQPEIRA